MRDIHLRPVRPEDDDFLYQLYASTRTAELEALNTDPGEGKAFLDLQFHAQRQQYAFSFPGADHRIVLRGDRPIGRTLVSRSANEIRLVEIAILPGHRRNGIGSSLIRALQVEAKRRRKPLCLQVLKTNPAQGLYRRLGCLVVGETELYLQMNWDHHGEGTSNPGGPAIK